MKKFLVFTAMLIVSMFLVFADTQVGPTGIPMSDSSFLVQGYYKGEKENTTVTMVFKDINNTDINHNDQDSTGTKVNVSDGHLGSAGTIFTWSMVGSSKSTTTLKFTFSTLQAEVNGIFYRPTYTLKMTINPTMRDGYNTTLEDSFYDDATKEQVVGGGAVTGTKASQSSAFTGASEVTYTGAYTGSRNRTWNRSGTCTLNISDYEQAIPGSYHYVCWVIAEYSIQ